MLVEDVVTTGAQVLKAADKLVAQGVVITAILAVVDREEGGREGPFGVLSASGWHTGAGWMKCYVATNQASEAKMRAEGREPALIGPSPGFTNLRWLKPVTPGDAISYRSTVTGTRELNSRPGWGLVFSMNEGFNQKGELVFSFEGKVLA